MKSKTLIKFLYKLIYVFIFLFFTAALTFIFFPYGKLKKPLELSIYDDTGLNVSIKSISPSIFLGLHLTGVKVYGGYRAGADGKNAKKNIAYVKNIYINDIISTGADYLLFRNIPLNLNFYGVKTASVKKGFINIPALNLKTIKTDLYIKNISGAKYSALSGNINFAGSISGSLNIKNADIKPMLKINSGVFKVKPDKAVYGKFSMLFNTMFKKGKDGYFVYDINNMFL
jgi:hypothetical protein